MPRRTLPAQVRELFYDDFRIAVGSHWDPLGSFWNTFGNVLGSFWNRFGICFEYVLGELQNLGLGEGG